MSFESGGHFKVADDYSKMTVQGLIKKTCGLLFLYTTKIIFCSSMYLVTKRD